MVKPQYLSLVLYMFRNEHRGFLRVRLSAEGGGCMWLWRFLWPDITGMRSGDERREKYG